MDLLRSFISLFNRTGETSSSTTRANSVDLSIPICYYGHTYVAQPNSDELKRATFILESRNKNISKNFSNLLSCHDENTIIIRDQFRQAIGKFEIRKIVVSCVDAKHQRLLAIFYDNDSSESSMGMECHLFLCRTKMVAKMVANKIGDKLNKLQHKPAELPPKIKLDQVNIMTRPNVCDFDYENINKFFREEVFNLSVQDPSSESSSTYLTTGCDSGRASTVASVDTKSEEIGKECINPIREDDELEPEVNMSESYKLYPRVKELLSESNVTNHDNDKLNKSIRKNKDPPISSSKSSPPDISENRGQSPKIGKNRYSEQYDRMGTREMIKEERDDKTCKKFSSERFSHQYELMGVTGRPELNNNEYVNNWDCLKSDIDKNENTLDPNVHQEDLLTEESIPECTSQNIQNRYSVHYDQQDELLFKEDEDEVFATEEEKDAKQPVDFSQLLVNRDVKLDRRSLHRLTFLSATDI